MAESMLPGSIPLAQATYRSVSEAPDRGEHLRILSGVFDGRSDQIWIDGAGHITPVGNALVAEAMLKELATSAALRGLESSPGEAPAHASPASEGKAPGS